MEETKVLNQNSTAKQIANFFNCSVQTVLMKSKKLNINFRRRTSEEHILLIDNLGKIRKRNNKNYYNKNIHKKILEYFSKNNELVKEIDSRLLEINKEIELLEKEKLNLEQQKNAINNIKFQ